MTILRKCVYICRPAGKYGKDTLEALENIVTEGNTNIIKCIHSYFEIPTITRTNVIENLQKPN